MSHGAAVEVGAGLVGAGAGLVLTGGVGDGVGGADVVGVADGVGVGATVGAGDALVGVGVAEWCVAGAVW